MPVTSEVLANSARAVMEDVLETMFFSTAVLVDCRHDPNAVAARIHFSGDPSGIFELALSRNLARQFACAFLALDEGDLPASAESEVTCELANMICGAALSRIHPDSSVRLGVPRPTARSAPLDGPHQCFETPEGILSVTLSVI